MEFLRSNQWDDLKLATSCLIIGRHQWNLPVSQSVWRRVSPLLIDKGDFASATSQSSAMMIWGGLVSEASAFKDRLAPVLAKSSG
jgi:hypothetical protein